MKKRKFNRVEEEEALFNYQIIPMSSTIPTDFWANAPPRVLFIENIPPSTANYYCAIILRWLSIRC